MAPLRTSRGLDRLVNFSDATVAIAITLLILPLVDVAGQIDHSTLGTVLRHNDGLLISFVVTFAVIGRFWTVHHHLFEYVRGYNSALLRVNLLWLAGIVFLPFSANVLSVSAGQPAISALYIGTMIVVTGAGAVMEWLIVRDPALADPDEVESLSLAPSLAFVILLVVALIVAVVFPRVNLYALFLLLLSGVLTDLLRRVARRRSSRAHVRRAADDAEH